MIEVKGVAVRPAEMRAIHGKTAAVCVRVTTGAGWPVDAGIAFGNNPADFLQAERWAARVKTGASIDLIGESMIGLTDHDVARVVLGKLTYAAFDHVVVLDSSGLRSVL